LQIDSGQFGKKVGKHASDFGLDPASPADRATVRARIEDIVANADEVREGNWNELRQGGGTGYLFFRKNDDVVRTKADDTFVTVMGGGASNRQFLRATIVPP